MKRLLNTLYITNPDYYLSLDGENVVIKLHDEEIGRVPLHTLDGIVTMGFAGASPKLMGYCSEKNISITFLSSSGRFLATVNGESRGNVLLRKEQYRISDDEEEALKIARNMIIGKIYNCRWILERATRDHSLRIDVERVKRQSNYLYNALINLNEVSSLAQLRGIEGEAASVYFSVFDELILQQKEHFHFDGRNRRPPLDNVNALLSFIYTLLAGICKSSLEAVGLDPYVGFLHTDRPGRISLALDLMEELRPIMADRFILTLINRKIVSPDGFRTKENGAVIMNDDTKKAVISAWQLKKQEMIIHPYLNENIEWGMIPYAQALLLARYIRGDLDEYPPIFWK